MHTSHFSKYAHFSDDEILTEFITNILKHNPRIRLGERLTGPVENVWKGKIVHDNPQPANVIALDHRPPRVKPEKITVSVSGIKVPFTELERPGWSSFQGKWIYPYALNVPHRKLLAEHRPGDMVTVVDDENQFSPYVLTEDDFKLHEYFIFRFASSV